MASLHFNLLIEVKEQLDQDAEAIVGATVTLDLFALKSKGFFGREEIEDVLGNFGDFGPEQGHTDLARIDGQKPTQSRHVAFRHFWRKVMINGATAKHEDDFFEARAGVVDVVVNANQSGPNLLPDFEIFPARRGAVRLVITDILVHLVDNEEVVGCFQLVSFHIQKSGAAGAALDHNHPLIAASTSRFPGATKDELIVGDLGKSGRGKYLSALDETFFKSGEVEKRRVVFYRDFHAMPDPSQVLQR